MKSVQHSDLKRVKQIAMNGYYSVLTTIDLFVLSFMGLLTRLSESLNKKQKRGFFLAFALIAGISVMEIVTLAVDGAPAKYRWLNIASNFLGFGLSPAVAICLVYVQDRKSAPRQNLRFAVGCEIAYLLFLAFSIPFGTVFSVSADNVYSRGTHFHIYIAVYFAAIFYLSLATILTARAFQNRSRALIYPLIVFLTAETIVQVALPDLHVTWLCVTLLAVLYYIYCTEMWNQLDALTGLLNQSSYLHRTAEMTRRGLRWADYYAREECMVANAVPTAEGAVQVAMEELPITLHSARVLILGFGRVGKLTAHRMGALGAKVTVSAQSYEDLAWAAAYGYETDRLEDLAWELGGFDLVVNTIPAPVLDERRLRWVDPGAFLLDLASAPGGIDRAAAQRRNLQVLQAPGLPGRVAPVTAAAAIRDAVYHILWEQEA